MPKLKLEFDGFDEVLSKLKKLEGDVKTTAEKALKKSHEYVTPLLEESAQKPNLPRKGKYSTGKTLKSLERDAVVQWVGEEAQVYVGFNIEKGGLPSIFMMYGTPRYMKNQKMYDAIFASKTQEKIRQIQEDTWWEEIRRLD